MLHAEIFGDHESDNEEDGSGSGGANDDNRHDSLQRILNAYKKTVRDRHTMVAVERATTPAKRVLYINELYEHWYAPEQLKTVVTFAAQLVFDYPKFYDKLVLGLRKEFSVVCAAIHKGVHYSALEPEMRHNEEIFAFAFQECLAMEYAPGQYSGYLPVSLRNPLSIFATEPSYVEWSKNLFQTLIEIIDNVIPNERLATLFMKQVWQRFESINPKWNMFEDVVLNHRLLTAGAIKYADLDEFSRSLGSSLHNRH